MAGVVGDTDPMFGLTALYQDLGDAWYAQCKARPGDAYHLRPAAEIGEQEFDRVRPMLGANLNQPHPFDVQHCVAETIRRFAHWPMPIDVVTSLAIQTGLVLVDNPAKSPAAINGRLGSAAAAFVVGPSSDAGAIRRQPQPTGRHYSVQRMPSEFDTSNDDLDR